jgi:hypothetical protein
VGRPQRRGSELEREVADYFAEEPAFPFADRRVKTGAKDKGDIGGIPGWVIECKAPGPGKPLNLPAALDEGNVEAANAGVPNYAAVVKRTRKNVREAYGVVPLWQLRAMIVALGPGYDGTRGEVET